MNGCNEYKHVTRRSVLGHGAAAAILASAPAWLPRVAYAQGGPARDILVSIFLRGGADGLTLCAPHGDNDYYRLRPSLAVARPDSSDPNRLRNLDGFFGLPPAMLPLLDAYQDGQLLFVHAAGSTDSTRSHFDAMNFMEAGKPRDAAISTGWLGRHLATSPQMTPNAPLRAMGFATGLPRTLVGGPMSLPIPYPEYVGLDGSWETQNQRQPALRAIYAKFVDPVKTAAANTLRTIDALQAIDFENYIPRGGAVYPEDDFGRSLKATAAMIKSGIGLEAIHIDFGGWDNHDDLGPIQGTMADNMGSFARGLAAFHADIMGDSIPKKVCTFVTTEFGRNVAENGSRGTDHGHGTCLIAMGEGIVGGRVLRNWPGLNEEQLFEGQDLEVTIDWRDVAAEIVQKRLKNNALAAVFPDYAPVIRGVARV